jgi:hypothetical protein
MFSRKTLIELVNALNFQTHDEVERFGLEFNIEEEITGKWVKEKETSIVKYLASNPEAVGPNGSNMAIEIIEYAIKNHRRFEPFEEIHSDLAHSLEKDGYEFTSSGIRKKLPREFPVVEQENQLISLLDKFGFSTAKGHYEQAIAAHSRGEWASANAQLRTFVESFWKRLHPEGSHPGLSEQSDSTFRLHLVILVIHHFLTRLELKYSNAYSRA